MIRDKWRPQIEHVGEIVGLTVYATMIDGQTGEVILHLGEPYTWESIERMMAIPYREYPAPDVIYWYTEDLPAEETQ